MVKGGLGKEGRYSPEQEVESLRRRVAKLEAAASKHLFDRQRWRLLNDELRCLFDDAPIGLCYIDTDLRYVHVNKWLARINGLPVAAHLGKTVGEVLPSVAAVVESQFRQVIATGQSVIAGSVHGETPAHPGVKQDYEHYYQADTNADGAIRGISCVVLDVTQRQENDSLLQRWAHIFEEVEMAIIVSAPDGTIELANPAAARLYGVSAERLVNTSIEGLYAPQVRTEVAEYSRRANEEGHVSFESTHIRQDGTAFDVQVTVTAVRDEQGDVSYRVANIEDITERRELEARRAEAEASQQRETQRRKYQDFVGRVVNVAPDAIIVARGDGRIGLVNEQAGRLFGYALDELVLLTMEQLMPARFRAKHLEHRKGYTASPDIRMMGSRDAKLVGLRKDGEEFPVEISLAPLQTEEEVVYISSIRDVSERLQREAEVRLHREEMAHVTRVASLGELQGALAHELNQPLAATMSNAQAALRFLQQDPLEVNELRSILSDIVADTRRSGDVIARLRAMMKKGDHTRELVDFNALLGEGVDLMRNEFVLKGVTVQLELDAAPRRISADVIQIQQVVLNLLMNASDAVAQRERGARYVTLSSQYDESHVTVSIRDSGQGIPETVLPRLFDSFYTTKRLGLGMGLAVCRSLVEAHGGRIWVADASSTGATLRFTLPVVGGKAL